MPEGHLLQLGLNALARAHELDYFTDGHRGAAMVAAHLLCKENRLNERACSRIQEMCDLNWGKTNLCRSFTESEPESARINEIGAALVEGGETLRQVGHNVIIAMLAIKGFRSMPKAATRERIDGVCALVRSFTPWQDMEPDSDVDPPAFADTVAASRYVLREAYEAVDRFVGFGQGCAGHILTFGQALIELADMGDVEWAESCRPAFRKHVTVIRLGPAPDARRIPDHRPSDLRPIDSAYWLKRPDHAVGIGHVFKYPYSFYNLLHRAEDPKLAEEWEQKAYHLF